MHEILKVEEVLGKGETAVVIFTRGHGTEIYDGDSGNGYTGYWKMNPDHEFDKVVLYWRDGDENRVYVADFVDVVDKVNGRRKLSLSNTKFRATTKSNWWGFTGNKGSNPVKYMMG